MSIDTWSTQFSGLADVSAQRYVFFLKEIFRAPDLVSSTENKQKQKWTGKYFCYFAFIHSSINPDEGDDVWIYICIYMCMYVHGCLVWFGFMAY